MTVILAVGNTDLARSLRHTLNDAGFNVKLQEYLNRRGLMEIKQLQEPTTLLLHDTYLLSSTRNATARDAEMFKLVEHLYKENRDKLRIVYLCERAKDDLFLGELVERGVYDRSVLKHLCSNYECRLQ